MVVRFPVYLAEKRDRIKINISVPGKAGQMGWTSASEVFGPGRRWMAWRVFLVDARWATGWGLGPTRSEPNGFLSRETRDSA